MFKNAQIVNTFLNLKRFKKIPNNFLLIGPNQQFKDLVPYLAQIIACKRGTQCSNRCESCLKIQHQDYSYFFALHPENDVIKVEHLLPLFDWISYVNNDFQPKIYWISEIDKMTLEAANKILKFLEDIRPHCYGILTTNNKTKLLPTILSRMQSFTCLNYSFHPAYLRTMTTLKTSDYAILHSLNSNIYFITPQFIEEQYSPTLDLVNVFFTILQAKRMEELYLWNTKQFTASFWFFLELLIIRLKNNLFNPELFGDLNFQLSQYYQMLLISYEVWSRDQAFLLGSQNHTNEDIAFLFWLNKIVAIANQ